MLNQRCLKMIVAGAFIGLAGVTFLAADTNDVLNGDFENWTATNNVPTNWDAAGKFIPEKWGVEDRPDEKGKLCRMVNSLDGADAPFGKYSLFLNGRLVSKQVYTANLGGNKLQVSLMAKGHDGNIIVRYRGYSWNPTNKLYVAYVMEFLNAGTGDEWRKYTAKVGLLYNRLYGMSLEIIGKDVVIDNLQAELSDAAFQYSQVEYNLPIAPDKVAIDGDFSEREWSSASGANFGFINTSGNLAKRQSEYYLSSDNTNLLICLRAPFEGALKQKIAERDGNVYEDDSYEIHINPSAGQKTPPSAYQFIVNALGTVYDARINNGLHDVGANKDWNCAGLKAASKCRDNTWTLELAIPLAEVGLEPGKAFGFNLCKNLKNPQEDSNLTGLGYFDYDKMALVRINKESPAVFWGSSGAVGDGNLNLFARIQNSSLQNRGCELSFDVNTEQVGKKEKRAVNVSPGAQETVHFNTGKNPGVFGAIGLNVQNRADQTVIVAHKINFEASVPLTQGIAGNKIAYYPVQNKIGVILTAAQMGQAAKVEITVTRNDIQVAKTFTDKIEMAADNNGQAFVSFMPAEEGTYRVSALVFDAGGNGLGYIADDVVVQKLAWLNNDCGKGKTVNRPFIPLAKSGRTISCWGRKYLFAGSGLPEQIISQDENVLAAPIAFAWMDKDAIKYGKNGKFKIADFSEQSASFTGETVFENFKIIAHGKLEYDGTIFYDIDIAPQGQASIPNLHFEMPFRDLKYFNTEDLWMSSHPAAGEYIDRSVPVWTPEYAYVPKGDRVHNSLYFPKGDGTIWTSSPSFLACNTFSATHKKGGFLSFGQIQGDFLPCLTFGNTLYGMCWLADNDRGWHRDAGRSSYEIIRAGTTSKVKINFISKPLKSSGVGRISFALAATPVRPRKTGLNYFDYQVMCGEWGGSAFVNAVLAGLDVTDNFLLDKYLAAVDPNGGKPVFFYIAKAYLSLGDPVARYYYNEWHTVPEVSYNFRKMMPTRNFGLNPDNYFGPAGCMYPERVDYMAYKTDVFMKNHPGLRGIYFDENYSVPCRDVFHRNCGYRMEDGTVQAGFHYYGMRELDKRVQAIFQKYNRPFPNLVVHSGFKPPVMSFADINLYGEVPTRSLDFIDYWDLPRLENFGAGAWGVNVMWLPQFAPRLLGAPNTLAHNRAMLAALKLFDFNIWSAGFCWPDLLAKFRATENKFGIAADDSRFLGYWQKENNQAVAGLPVFVKASFFVRKGKGALVYIANFDKARQAVRVSLDFNKWNINNIKVTDAETGQPIKLDGQTVALEIEGHDFRNLLIEQLR